MIETKIGKFISAESFQRYLGKQSFEQRIVHWILKLSLLKDHLKWRHKKTLPFHKPRLFKELLRVPRDFWHSQEILNLNSILILLIEVAVGWSSTNPSNWPLFETRRSWNFCYFIQDLVFTHHKILALKKYWFCLPSRDKERREFEKHWMKWLVVLKGIHEMKKKFNKAQLRW